MVLARSVMVSLTLVGILAVLAKPAVDSTFARARMAEAKTNLTLIRRSQEVWVYDTTNNNAGTYEQFSAIGYTGNGNYSSSCNANTFAPLGCNSLRYNYISTVNGKNFQVVAHAPSDKSKQYLFLAAQVQARRFTTKIQAMCG